MTHTNIEQSQELLQLGLSDKTADMHIFTLENKEEYFYYAADFYSKFVIPCWSTERLLSLLPNSIKYNNFIYTLNIIKNKDNKWIISYEADDYIAEMIQDSSLSATVYSMVKWLIINKCLML